MYGLADNKWVSLVVFSSFAARFGRLKMDHVGKGRELLFSTFERLCDATKFISIHPPTHSARRPRERDEFPYRSFNLITSVANHNKAHRKRYMHI